LISLAIPLEALQIKGTELHAEMQNMTVTYILSVCLAKRMAFEFETFEAKRIVR
jgi:hypothetical protein